MMSLDNLQTDRRRFFAASAASISMLTAGLPSLARTAAARPPLQLGLVTYQWGKDMPLAELLEVCQRTRFSGVELRSTHAHGVEPGMSSDQRADARRRFAKLRACSAAGFTGWCLLEDGATPTDIPAALEENRSVFDRLAGSTQGVGP